MGGNSWLDVVKKALLRSPTKHMYNTKTLKARMREDDEPAQVDQDKKSSKRRWNFKKTALHETTTILHVESSTTLSTSTKPIIISQTDERHAMAVAKATTAAAVAKVQAAVEVEVIRLTSPSFSFERDNAAALVIQTSFRSYLARRAVEALRGVVKLQALVRGHNVRRRTKMTLKCMQALVRVQARVCHQRCTNLLISNEPNYEKDISAPNSFWGSHVAYNNKSIMTRELQSSIITDEWNRHDASRMEEIQDMLQKTQVAGQKSRKDLFTHQVWRSGQNEYDLEDREYFYVDQIDTTCQRCCLSPSYHYQQQRVPYSSPLHHHSQSPITPSSSLLRIKPSARRSFSSSGTTGTQTLRGSPSYMSATASAMARIRPQRRSATDQGDKKTSARKRLTFNVYGGGISDSELDANFKSPIEPRLSMSSCCKQSIQGDNSRPSLSQERSCFR